MAATVKATGYVRTLKDASGKLRYYAFRSRELPGEERGLFGRSSDHADLRSFIRSIRNDPLLQDRRTRKGVLCPPKMHSLVFSLSRAEFEKSGLTSWKPVIRQVFAEFEHRRGIRVDWVAAEHQSLRHPHCHVALKAVYTDESGNRYRWRLTREDIDELRFAARLIVRQHRERYWQQIREEREAEWAERRARETLRETVSLMATTFLDALQREEREQQRAAQLIRQRRRRSRPGQARGR